VLLVLASALAGGITGLASGRLGAYVGRDLKKSVATKIMSAEYRTVERVSSGDAISIVNSDCKQISAFLSSDLFSLVTQILTSICAFVYLLSLHPLLGILTFAYTPIGMILAGKINRRLNTFYPVSSNQKGEALTAVEQALSSLPVVKSFGIERKMLNKLNSVFENLHTTDQRIKVWDSLLQPACLSVANAPRLIFAVAGGIYALSGQLELGVFIAITQLLGYIIPPTVMLPFMLNNVNRTAASMQRINNILNLPIAQGHEADQKEAAQLRGDPSIIVENVSFSYDSDSGTNEPVLRDISLSIKGAGVTVISGGSGSGKSTLLSLMTGLYRPDRGGIKINGQDTERMRECDIAKRFSVLPQEIHLFSASILENIQVGKEEAEPSELMAAAQATGVYDFTVKKEHGFKTMVGDGGAALSGGQAQKLALARAYLKDAPIWLLDEPTSALDAFSEKELHELVRNAADTKLVLIAAHRLSTIRLADRIIFMKDGMIAADGTWDEVKQTAYFLKTVNTLNESEESEAIGV
jgi:ABC-type multidrug transport system fused ATPase/permease subunit